MENWTLQSLNTPSPLPPCLGQFVRVCGLTSYFSWWWLHAEASFFRSTERSREERRSILLSLALARSQLTFYAHTPHARTHARTLAVHRSCARMLLISCPPEAVTGGSASFIDRPTPSSDGACATSGSANDFLLDDLLNLKMSEGGGKGVNQRTIESPHDFIYCVQLVICDMINIDFVNCIFKILKRKRREINTCEISSITVWF